MIQRVKKAPADNEGQINSPTTRSAYMITDEHRRRIDRFGEEGVLPALREAFGQRPEWRGFDAHQLSVLLFLRGYLSAPPEEADVEAAMPLALEDREGDA